MPVDAHGRIIIANPECAICGVRRPLEDPCTHEAAEMRSLEQQALHRWLDAHMMQQIQAWVFEKARSHIMGKFERHLERNRKWFESDLARIPYFQTYTDYRGRPPNLPPVTVDAISADIYRAEVTFQTRINESWKHCIRKFPKALDRAWQQIRSQYPVVDPSRVMMPPAPRRRASIHLW